MQRRIGIYGGSFNPIHKGHIRLAEVLAEELRLDKVLLVPSNPSPYKQRDYELKGTIRYEMCRLAVQDNPLFAVDDIELVHPQLQYTYQTLGAISEREGNSRLFLLMGSDTFKGISSWVGFQEIIQYAVICAMPRTDEAIESLLEARQKLQIKGVEAYLSLQGFIAVSSTEIREKIRRGEDVSPWLPSGVEGFIRKKGIYLNRDQVKKCAHRHASK